ncbi:hypothetical protein SEA_ANTUNA_62 [Microbacterium phage Antuna]|nr:hypothetical protein SEA_ANTUNA_62 [Microbacterium phage Antuna]
MAASQSGTVVGVITLEDDSKRAMDRLSDALDRHALATEPKTTEAERVPLPGPTIENWPIKSHPPVVIAPCPHCGSAIEANPVTWEIVIDPTATTESTTVRGQMQHEHDGGVLVRWPFVATYTPPPVDAWEPIDAPLLDEDVAEGQERTGNGEPWEFTPDENDELSIESAVFQALGGASTCWEAIEHAGVFDSTRAREIGDRLLEHLDVEMRREVARRAALIDLQRGDALRKIRRALDIITRHDAARKDGGTAPSKRQTISIVEQTLGGV